MVGSATEELTELVASFGRIVPTCDVEDFEIGLPSFLDRINPELVKLILLIGRSQLA